MKEKMKIFTKDNVLELMRFVMGAVVLIGGTLLVYTVASALAYPLSAAAERVFGCMTHILGDMAHSYVRALSFRNVSLPISIAISLLALSQTDGCCMNYLRGLAGAVISIVFHLLGVYRYLTDFKSFACVIVMSVCLTGVGYICWVCTDT